MGARSQGYMRSQHYNKWADPIRVTLTPKFRASPEGGSWNTGPPSLQSHFYAPMSTCWFHESIVIPTLRLWYMMSSGMGISPSHQSAFPYLPLAMITVALVQSTIGVRDMRNFVVHAI